MIPITTVYRAAEVKFIVANSGAVALISCGEFRGFDHAAMAAEMPGQPIIACGRSWYGPRRRRARWSWPT